MCAHYVTASSRRSSSSDSPASRLRDLLALRIEPLQTSVDRRAGANQVTRDHQVLAKRLGDDVDVGVDGELLRRRCDVRRACVCVVGESEASEASATG